MGWPKGVPRKGYVKKDGTAHAPKTKRVKESSTLTLKAAKKKVLDSDAETPALHGMKGNGPITEPCPRCNYAYADGGYCPSCHWMKAIIIDPYGTHSGRRF